MNYQDKYFSKESQSSALIGPDDVPFRGNSVPDLRQEEYEQLKLTYDSHTVLLDLEKEQDLELYNKIIDRCAKGLSQLRLEKFHSTNTWHVLLQWFDKYNELDSKQNYGV